MAALHATENHIPERSGTLGANADSHSHGRNPVTHASGSVYRGAATAAGGETGRTGQRRKRVETPESWIWRRDSLVYNMRWVSEMKGKKYQKDGK